MWPTFHTEKPFEPVVFTRTDVSLVSLVWGLTIGFGYFVVLHAVRLTLRLKRWSIFVVLVWLEILGCICYGLPAILYTNSVIEHSFWIYFFIWFGWILQLQCLVQIIVNRVCILIDDPQTRRWLKLGMLIWIGLINLGVAVIWIPARLQINETYVHINDTFDKIEKGLYLITDASLNWLFIYIVKKRLVSIGLTRYDKLVKFNMLIIWASLAMDVMIIGTMFLSNTFLYTIFHPLAFIVKLEIEMTMSNLIVTIATHTQNFHPETSGVIDLSTGPAVSEINSLRTAKAGGVRNLQVTVDIQSISHTDRSGGPSKIGELVDEEGLASIKMSPLASNAECDITDCSNLETDPVHPLDLRKLEDGVWTKLAPQGGTQRHSVVRRGRK